MIGARDGRDCQVYFIVERGLGFSLQVMMDTVDQIMVPTVKNAENILLLLESGEHQACCIVDDTLGKRDYIMMAIADQIMVPNVLDANMPNEQSLSE